MTSSTQTSIAGCAVDTLGPEKPMPSVMICIACVPSVCSLVIVSGGTPTPERSSDPVFVVLRTILNTVHNHEPTGKSCVELCDFKPNSVSMTVRLENTNT